MMTEEKKYNGWTNYETWNVALWIDNDESSYDYWREKAKEAYEQAEEIENPADPDEPGHDKDEAKATLAGWLKDEITEGAPDLGASCYADLLGAALSSVDWYEIAEHMVNDIE